MSLNFVSPSNKGTVLIFGEAANDSAAHSPNGPKIKERSKTNTNAQWDFSTVIGSGFQHSPDVSTIIHEIVNRPGWSLGNSLSLMLHAVTGGTANINTFDHLPSEAPELTIWYSVTPSPAKLANIGAAAAGGVVLGGLIGSLVSGVWTFVGAALGAAIGLSVLRVMSFPISGKCRSKRSRGYCHAISLGNRKRDRTRGVWPRVLPPGEIRLASLVVGVLFSGCTDCLRHPSVPVRTYAVLACGDCQ